MTPNINSITASPPPVAALWGPKMPDIEIAAEERRAIMALHRIAKKWPKSLWLFSASGSLWVMRAGPDGEKIKLGNGEGNDPSYAIAPIDIPNDGGDW